MLQYVLSPPQATSGLTSTISLFGIQIGADASGNFALTPSGLAVRTPDGRFVRKERGTDFLVDVTPLILPLNPYVCRVPSVTVEPDDLIVTSDPPNFSALYVLDASRPDYIEGLDIGTALRVRYNAPANLFLNFFVRVVSLIDAFVGQEQ